MSSEIIIGGTVKVLVSEEDYPYLSQFHWCINSKGYVQRTNGSTKVKMHREVAQRMGLTLEGRQVDHISRDKLDNRRCNLRSSSSIENNWNRTKVKGKAKGTTSGFKGVNKSPKHSWRSRITYCGQIINLGMYLTEEDAALAYNRKARELFGEFATLNDVVDDGRILVPQTKGKVTPLLQNREAA